MKRIFTVLALVAVTFATSFSGSAAHADNSPYLLDFMTLSSKRADLRLAVASKGMEGAFNAWLRTAHPDAARQGFQTVAGVQTRAASCCKAGKMCGRCSACCTKAPCPSICCTHCPA